MQPKAARILASSDSLDFGELILKANAVDETEPKDATITSFGTNSNNTDIGFWECSPGRFRTVRENVHEVVLILKGSGTLIGDDGINIKHTKGDLVLIPNGWSGVWEIHEPFRKMYTTISL